MPPTRPNRALLAAIPLLSAALACAQTADSGAVTGKLTDLYSHPLAGVTVTLRNTRTGAETHTTTAKNGAYRVAGLPPGQYTLAAASPQLGEAHLEGIEIAAGYEQHLQAAVRMAPSYAASNTEPGTSTATLKKAAFLNAGAAPQPAPPPPPMVLLPGLPILVAANTPTLPIHTSVEPSTPESAAETEAAAARLHTQLANLAATQAVLRANTVVEPPGPDALPLTASTLTEEELQSLPVTSRDWQNLAQPNFAQQDLAQAAPPPANQPNGLEGAEITQDTRPPAEFRIDGADRRLAFTARGISRATAQPLVSPSTSSSLRSVETGSHTQTHSGGARLHAEASLFTRQNLWAAQNPLTQLITATPAPGSSLPAITTRPFTPEDREATWSIGVGGPLHRYHLNWFASLEGENRNHPGIATIRHPENFFAQPTWDELTVLSSRLGVPTSDPQGQGLQKYSEELIKLSTLLGQVPRSSTHWAGFARIDWTAAARHRFMLEGSSARMDAPGAGLTRTEETYGNHSFGSRKTSDAWLLARWEAFLTPNLMAVTQLSASRRIQTHPAGTPSDFENPLLQPNAWGQLPQISIDSRDGFTIGNPARFGAGSSPDERSYQGQEGLHWMHSRLLLQSGFDLRHSDDAVSLLRNHTGTYHYSRLENFISDALVFEQYGLTGQLDPLHPHNCDQRGKAWRDTSGQLQGRGYLPCYSWYSQTLGPTEWRLSTNDLAGFATLQWRSGNALVLSASLHWERQQLPPPIALVDNPDLPLTQQSPTLGNQWSPRIGLAWGSRESRWPVLQLGYGIYFGRTPNSVLLSVLSQTGSPNGDLDYFLRPTDNLQNKNGGAPPFPYVLAGSPGPQSSLKPGALEFASGFRNPEVHQAAAGIEESFPWRIRLSARATATLARRLPTTVDTNYAPLESANTIAYTVVDPTGAGPLKSPQIKVPFFASQPTQPGTNGRLNPNYQQISQIISRANSTYEAAALRLSRSTQRGLSFHLQYTYSHTMDWNPNEGTQLLRASVFDPTDFQQEYGTSDLDVRHAVSGILLWQSPWKLPGNLGRLFNAWSLSGTGHYRSGMPFTMHTTGSIPAQFVVGGGVIPGLGPGMNGYGGDNRLYSIGRNTYRYPATWKADVRLGKRLSLPRVGELQLMAESFNLFNHRNVTEIETVGYDIEPGSSSSSVPTLTFLTDSKTGAAEFGQPINANATDYYRPRQVDFGLRLRFLTDPDE